jgi:hypothetical protein
MPQTDDDEPLVLRIRRDQRRQRSSVSSAGDGQLSQARPGKLLEMPLDIFREVREQFDSVIVYTHREPFYRL